MMQILSFIDFGELVTGCDFLLCEGSDNKERDIFIPGSLYCVPD